MTFQLNGFNRNDHSKKPFIQSALISLVVNKNGFDKFPSWGGGWIRSRCFSVHANR